MKFSGEFPKDLTTRILVAIIPVQDPGPDHITFSVSSSLRLMHCYFFFCCLFYLFIVYLCFFIESGPEVARIQVNE